MLIWCYNQYQAARSKVRKCLIFSESLVSLSCSLIQTNENDIVSDNVFVRRNTAISAKSTNPAKNK